MARIKFYRGLKPYYSVDKYQDALYFCTDTQEIIMNDKTYGFNQSVNIVSMVEYTPPGTFTFRTTNKGDIVIQIPDAQKLPNGTYISGFMSAANLETFDNIPNVYATKEELKQQVVGVYHFRGVVETFNDLPTENLSTGDTYKVKQEFDTEEGHFAEGTHVVWNGTKWVPMEGESGYSREEADAKFVAWSDSTKRHIPLPVDGSITAVQDTSTGSSGVLLCQRNYGNGNVTEVGNVRNKLTLNATERPQIDLAGGTQEKIAFESDLIKYGMYYPGVKVDTQKLFALTKASTENDIKAALQLETASGSYTLPTEEILNDCLGKGYQLLSNWMPVSVAWNGAAWVFYIVGQTYMNQPNSVATVSIKITNGVYSVFQAAKITELVDTDDIRTLSREVNIPIRTLQDRVYTQDEILKWFGVTTVVDLKSIISTGGIQYLRFGILLSGNPHYYKMPIEYCAFESANQIKLVFNGLDTHKDVPSKYEIILNLDGTIISGQSNISMTITALADSEDLEYVKRMVGNMELKADTVTGQFIPALEQSYIDDLGTPENINGQPYDAVSNNYTIGDKYYVLGYFDESLVFHYDMYSLSSNMGVIVDSTLNQFKSVDNDIKDIQDTLTWEDVTE